MKLLLDTHTVLWFADGHGNLSQTAKDLICDTGNIKYISLFCHALKSNNT